jgi:hypothetical protein
VGSQNQVKKSFKRTIRSIVSTKKPSYRKTVSFLAKAATITINEWLKIAAKGI